MRYSRVIEKSATATAKLNARNIFDDDDVADFFSSAFLLLAAAYSPQPLAVLAAQTYFISIAHFRYQRNFFYQKQKPSNFVSFCSRMEMK